MPRPKRPVPTPKHVGHANKMKRAAHVGSKLGSAKPKPRVKVGTAAAKALGIVQPLAGQICSKNSTSRNTAKAR